VTGLDAPRTDDREGIAALRAVLDEAGYTAEGIQAAVGEPGGFTRDPGDVPLYVRRLQPDSALSTLVKLFLLDLVLPADEVERAVAPLTAERLLAMGVLRREGDALGATFNLSPSDELLIGSDRFDGVSPDRPDHVLGLSVSARALAAIVVRHWVGTALDLGTGSGIHALTAAAHAGHVVGVDINPRAVRFAEFNAALNGIENVEFRVGNLFGPVEGETFDLIVSNPPYVLSPDREYIFRDSGLPGDSFNEGLIRRLPEFLNEAGYAHVLIEWGHGPDEHPGLVPRRWTEGSGCDALVLHYLTQDPLAYAAQWNAELRRDPSAYGAALDRWIAYDRELGFQRFSWGTVIMRRRAGRNWVRTLTPGVSAISLAPHHILRLFASQDYLSTLGVGHGLLDGVFELAEDHRFDQTFVLRDREGQLERMTLRLEGGLRTAAPLDEPLLRIVALLDGHRPLHDVMAEVAEGVAEPMSTEEFAVRVLPSFARLIDLGLVVPGSGVS
jgi:hypothetical protein